MPANTSDADHLQFIYDRLINFQGDKPSMKHMLELEAIIKRVRYLEVELPKMAALAKEVVDELKKIVNDQ